jgi:hypothetical protein
MVMGEGQWRSAARQVALAAGFSHSHTLPFPSLSLTLSHSLSLTHTHTHTHLHTHTHTRDEPAAVDAAAGSRSERDQRLPSVGPQADATGLCPAPGPPPVRPRPACLPLSLERGPQLTRPKDRRSSTRARQSSMSTRWRWGERGQPAAGPTRLPSPHASCLDPHCRQEAPLSRGYSPFLNFEVQAFDETLYRLLELGATMDGAVQHHPFGKVRHLELAPLPRAPRCLHVDLDLATLDGRAAHPRRLHDWPGGGGRSRARPTRIAPHWLTRPPQNPSCKPRARMAA